MTNDEIEVHYAAFLKTLGQRIKQFRKARKLSLHDMVVKHGYHDSQWRRFERGGAANMLSLLKIARAFDTSLSELLEGLGQFPADGAAQEKKKESAAKRAGSKVKKTT
jgi:transcriptional regulator with XRE-family HTH domain